MEISKKRAYRLVCSVVDSKHNRDFRNIVYFYFLKMLWERRQHPREIPGLQEKLEKESRVLVRIIKKRKI